MKLTLRYIVRDIDRHGNVRLYFRRNGQKIRLRGPEGSPDFLADYRLAVMGEHPKRAIKRPDQGTNPVSMRDLIEHYYRSSAYLQLAPRTRRVRALILDCFCMNRGDGEKPFAALEPYHLKLRRDAMVDRPEAANGMIKALRQVYAFAVDYNLHSTNPAKEVRYLAGNPDGITAWSEDDVKNFVAVHSMGTTAHLAMSLALFIGQRRSDIVRLGPQHIMQHHGREGFQFTQHKNRDGKPIKLWVPIVPALREIIDASPTGQQTFVTTHFGKPFTEDGFGNRFRKWCNEAGLEGRSIHGLRKTAASVLAENGCTDREIMAITGHKTSKEITRYTESARQKVRAINALQKTQTHHKDTKHEEHES